MTHLDSWSIYTIYQLYSCKLYNHQDIDLLFCMSVRLCSLNVIMSQCTLQHIIYLRASGSACTWLITVNMQSVIDTKCLPSYITVVNITLSNSQCNIQHGDPPPIKGFKQHLSLVSYLPFHRLRSHVASVLFGIL